MLRPTTRLFVAVFIAAAIPAGCVSANAISQEREAVERAAIHEDLRKDTATLFKIAADRAKRGKPELRDRHVVCAIADIQTTFKSETHAVQTITYACGIATWKPNQGRAVATPTIALDLLKEGPGVWLINAFL